MRTLFLDLASHSGLLACIDAERFAASVAVDRRISDRELVPLYEQLLQEAGWQPSSIERIACVTGPGGFTSLRVAAAFANALSFSLHVPLAGIHLSDLYGARCAPPMLWMHSTKKEQLFARGFGTFPQDFAEPMLWALGDFLHVLPATTVWAGELIPEHAAAIEKTGATPASLRPLTEILPDFLARQVYSPQTLKPWYGRGW